VDCKSALPHRAGNSFAEDSGVAGALFDTGCGGLEPVLRIGRFATLAIDPLRRIGAYRFDVRPSYPWRVRNEPDRTNRTGRDREGGHLVGLRSRLNPQVLLASMPRRTCADPVDPVRRLELRTL
jgi:hypothetical protein